MKPLVLGTAVNYTKADVSVFLESLRGTGYEGQVAFLAGRVDTATRAYLESKRVEIVPYHSFSGKGVWYIREALARIFRSCPFPTALRNSLAGFFWSCESGRYFHYRRFLHTHPEFTEILLADVRDVVFQENPFGREIPPLGFFEEYDGMTLETDKINSGWIAGLYGDDVLRAMGKYQIICSGVTIARRPGCLAYLDAMCDLLAVRNFPFGLDQGVHNFVARVKGLPQLEVFPYGNDLAANIALAPSHDFEFDANRNLLAANGRIVSVVHQYDRHPEFASRVRRRYMVDCQE